MGRCFLFHIPFTPFASSRLSDAAAVVHYVLDRLEGQTLTEPGKGELYASQGDMNIQKFATERKAVVPEGYYGA